MKHADFQIKDFIDFCDTAGYGIIDWADSAEIHEEDGFYKIGFSDLDNEEPRVFYLDRGNLLRAMRKYCKMKNKSFPINYDRFLHLLCDWDCVDFSNIIQLAIFDEIVYC